MKTVIVHIGVSEGLEDVQSGGKLDNHFVSQRTACGGDSETVHLTMILTASDAHEADLGATLWI